MCRSPLQPSAAGLGDLRAAAPKNGREPTRKTQNDRACCTWWRGFGEGDEKRGRKEKRVIPDMLGTRTGVRPQQMAVRVSPVTGIRCRSCIGTTESPRAGQAGSHKITSGRAPGGRDPPHLVGDLLWATSYGQPGEAVDRWPPIDIRGEAPLWGDSTEVHILGDRAARRAADLAEGGRACRPPCEQPCGLARSGGGDQGKPAPEQQRHG
jgi:hypothetical protein